MRSDNFSGYFMGPYSISQDMKCMPESFGLDCFEQQCYLISRNILCLGQATFKNHTKLRHSKNCLNCKNRTVKSRGKKYL